MEEINVIVDIKGDQNRVWELLSDHAGLKRFPGVIDSRLEQAGDTETNGVGAIRYINVGLIQFTEKITRFEAPHRYEYQIIQCSAPLEHHGGFVSLEPVPGGVRVTWNSRITIPLPLIGGPAGWIAKLTASEGFRGILKAVKKQVEA